MSLGSEIENQLFAVRRVVLASGWRQGLTSLFNVITGDVAVSISNSSANKRAMEWLIRFSSQIV